jgi:DNA-binding NarL/FixJ family response regulator
MMLEANGIEIAGEAADGRETVAQGVRLRPNVALIDIRMPIMDGIEAVRLLAQRAPDVRTMVLTTYDLDEYVYAALRAGASGFLLKSAPTAHLAQGVRLIADGGALLDPDLTRRLVERHLAAPPPGDVVPPAVRALTEREREVLVEVARGLSNTEIAARLYVGEATVETHVNHILSKLGLRDRVQAVVLAYECGLIRPSG